MKKKDYKERIVNFYGGQVILVLPLLFWEKNIVLNIVYEELSAMKKSIINMIKLLSKFVKKDKKLITIIYRGYSGSNLSPIIERLENDKDKDYTIKVINEGKADSDFVTGRVSKIDLYKNRIEKYRFVFKSNLVITTHGFYRLRDDNTMLNLWHGIPMKSMSLMNKSKNDEVNVFDDDYFLSTSDFYNTIMNACLGIRAEQYFVAGYPRNDYLFNQNGISNLKSLLKRNIEGKIILFMPTYREKGDEKREGNIFGFDTFDIEKFNDFLRENNLLFIMKLHPNEENIVYEKYLKYINDRIILLKSDDLEREQMDLYKMINAIDLLVTDYSSIYFDYLLLDRPIIFTPVDYEKYKRERGFLLEPYDFWAPGPKCLNQRLLQNEILRSLDDAAYYKKEREIIRNIMHKYQDGNSTERIMELIEKIMR